MPFAAGAASHDVKRALQAARLRCGKTESIGASMTDRSRAASRRFGLSRWRWRTS
ncbi:alanyl-tRNA synthetase [Burkholderia thailandensis]|nr:alanyl-tRNA synthetase [Burkholderia thailandensis]PNE67405.1 alanyl-tRNA synthetase [Burkholderia thailandensis]PNE79396.1 alanyl-tRNA synthetase [Burkholderia thailandensis]PNE85337.1 alanyl-tRNA synthetase [Burkholderia thailandensis]